MRSLPGYVHSTENNGHLLGCQLVLCGNIRRLGSRWLCLIPNSCKNSPKKDTKESNGGFQRYNNEGVVVPELHMYCTPIDIVGFCLQVTLLQQDMILVFINQGASHWTLLVCCLFPIYNSTLCTKL